MNSTENHIDITMDYENPDNNLELVLRRDNKQPRKLDSVVTSVIRKFKRRARFGQRKYGTDLDREDLTFLEWVEHAQEEHMDAILYLEKIKQTEERRLASTSSESTTYLFMIVYILMVLCMVLSMSHIMERLP